MIVGLGNPGAKYTMTRHNAGFIVLDKVSSEFGLSWSSGRFEAEWAKGRVAGSECVLLKPQTFMNLSGKSVAKAMSFFKIGPEDLVVFHDDLDMPWGKVKTREGGGHGGHNGIRSIIGEIGTKDFHRVKLGIGRPTVPQMDVSSWVLSRMTDDEMDQLVSEMTQESLTRLEQIFNR